MTTTYVDLDQARHVAETAHGSDSVAAYQAAKYLFFVLAEVEELRAYKAEREPTIVDPSPEDDHGGYRVDYTVDVHVYVDTEGNEVRQVCVADEEVQLQPDMNPDHPAVRIAEDGEWPAWRFD